MDDATTIIFAEGDYVLVTNGPLRGATGVIVAAVAASPDVVIETGVPGAESGPHLVAVNRADLALRYRLRQGG